MKSRYSVTVAMVNLDNGVDIEFDSYNDAIHFAHAALKSPDCHSVDIWEYIPSQDRWIVKYSNTKQTLVL